MAKLTPQKSGFCTCFQPGLCGGFASPKKVVCFENSKYAQELFCKRSKRCATPLAPSLCVFHSSAAASFPSCVLVF
eukprot:g45317.t1